MEALIVADQLCLSAFRLKDICKKLQEDFPDVIFRYATDEESELLIAQTGAKFLPFMFIGSDYLEGLFSYEALYDWVLQQTN